MSSKRDDGSGELEGAEKTAGGPIVAGSDGAELLELGEEVLNEMASAV